MRFTKENVRLEELSQSVRIMQGDLCLLHRVQDEDLPSLVSLFTSPDVYTTAHLKQPPDVNLLRNFLFDDLSLLIWKVFGANDDGTPGSQVGYIGWVNYAGPPFLFVLPLEEDLDLGVLQNGFELIVKAYFETTSANELCFYADVPVPEEIHTTLVEGGFDLWQEVAGVDSEKEATYVIERGTYDAYYGETSEEDEL